MQLLEDRAQSHRPRSSRAIEPLPLRLPQGKSLGPAIAAKRAPNGKLVILHHVAVMPGDTTDYLPQLLRFENAGCNHAAGDLRGRPPSRPLARHALARTSARLIMVEPS